MKGSYLKGLAFGLTSGIITTLGMMIGLSAGTQSRLAVIGGILTVAVADAFSDAFGIHVAEESDHKGPYREVWEATIATFIGKLFFASTFFLPVLLFSLSTAIWVSIAWGMLLLGAISWWMAVDKKENPIPVLLEHWVIAAVVIIITHFLGLWINHTFGTL